MAAPDPFTAALLAEIESLQENRRLLFDKLRLDDIGLPEGSKAAQIHTLDNTFRQLLSIPRAITNLRPTDVPRLMGQIQALPTVHNYVCVLDGIKVKDGRTVYALLAITAHETRYLGQVGPHVLLRNPVDQKLWQDRDRVQSLGDQVVDVFNWMPWEYDYSTAYPPTAEMIVRARHGAGLLRFLVEAVLASPPWSINPAPMILKAPQFATRAAGKGKKKLGIQVSAFVLYFDINEKKICPFRVLVELPHAKSATAQSYDTNVPDPTRLRLFSGNKMPQGDDIESQCIPHITGTDGQPMHDFNSLAAMPTGLEDRQQEVIEAMKLALTVATKVHGSETTKTYLQSHCAFHLRSLGFHGAKEETFVKVSRHETLPHLVFEISEPFLADLPVGDKKRKFTLPSLSQSRCHQILDNCMGTLRLTEDPNHGLLALAVAIDAHQRHIRLGDPPRGFDCPCMYAEGGVYAEDIPLGHCIHHCGKCRLDFDQFQLVFGPERRHGPRLCKRCAAKEREKMAAQDADMKEVTGDEEVTGEEDEDVVAVDVESDGAWLDMVKDD